MPQSSVDSGRFFRIEPSSWPDIGCNSKEATTINTALRHETRAVSPHWAWGPKEIGASYGFRRCCVCNKQGALLPESQVSLNKTFSAGTALFECSALNNNHVRLGTTLVPVIELVPVAMK